MNSKLCILVILAFTATFAFALPKTRKTNGVYIATIKPIYKSNSTVAGKVVVFTNMLTSGVITYAGYATGVEPNLLSSNCTAIDGCGAHLHLGKSCKDITSQGPNLFVSPVVTDPWVSERYSSDYFGHATYGGVVTVGTKKLAGRSFVSKYIF